ncbi:MAG: ABC transporter permease [bacterium]
MIGFIVLCVACINFINLSTARSAQRGKEIGVRKVIGARKADLVHQLFGESILMTFLAFVLALVLVVLFLSPFNELSGKHFTIGAALNRETVFGLFAIMVVASIFSGGYPALYLSSFEPIKVLKGSLHEGLNDSLLRKILVTVQFSVSIILIICAIVIMNQIGFIRNKKLGFDKEHLVYVNLTGEARLNIDVLKAEVLKHPNVIGAAAADRGPVNQGNFTTINKWEGKSSDDALIFNVMSIDHEYLDLLGLKIVQGRKFSKKFSQNGLIVNEEAIRQMGMDSPIGKRLEYWSESNIISGVVNDYHFKPLHRAITPLIITNDPSKFRVLFVKIRPENVFDTITALRQTFLQIAPDYPFEYHFLDERIDSLYRAEVRTGQIINWFTFLTIFTSCLGLFGLAAFMAQNRTKEIGIRKVLGASVFKIVSLLSTEFAKLVLLANIIAWPIGYFAMRTWLQNYAYRIDLSLRTFVLSASVVLTIALLTVSSQAIKAAIANPVDSLKDE